MAKDSVNGCSTFRGLTTQSFESKPLPPNNRMKADVGARGASLRSACRSHATQLILNALERDRCIIKRCNV
jgi:hypothetical protein